MSEVNFNVTPIEPKAYLVIIVGEKNDEVTDNAKFFFVANGEKTEIKHILTVHGLEQNYPTVKVKSYDEETIVPMIVELTK